LRPQLATLRDLTGRIQDPHPTFDRPAGFLTMRLKQLAADDPALGESFDAALLATRPHAKRCISATAHNWPFA